MYCLPDEVRNVLRPGGGRSVASGSDNLPSDYLIGFITEAQNEIDARLGTRYPVPFPDGAVPKVVQSITRDFAAFYADLSHRGQVDYTSQYDPILLRRQTADKLLADIVAGKADLGLAPAPDGASTEDRGAGTPRNVYAGRLFDPRSMVDTTPVVDPWGSGRRWP